MRACDPNKVSVLALQRKPSIVLTMFEKIFSPTDVFLCLFARLFFLRQVQVNNYDIVLFFRLNPAAEIKPRFFSACYVRAPSSGQKEIGPVIAPVKRGSVKSDLFLVRFYVCHAVDTMKLYPFVTTSGIIYASWQIHLTKALDAVSIGTLLSNSTNILLSCILSCGGQ